MCDHAHPAAGASEECPASSAPSESTQTTAVADPAEHPRLNDLTMSERTIHRTCCCVFPPSVPPRGHPTA